MGCVFWDSDEYVLSAPCLSFNLHAQDHIKLLSTLSLTATYLDAIKFLHYCRDSGSPVIDCSQVVATIYSLKYHLLYFNDLTLVADSINKLYFNIAVMLIEQPHVCYAKQICRFKMK